MIRNGYKDEGVVNGDINHKGEAAKYLKLFRFQKNFEKLFYI